MGINFEGDAADATRYTVFLSLEGEEAFLGNRGVRVRMCVRGVCSFGGRFPADATRPEGGNPSETRESVFHKKKSIL